MKKKIIIFILFLFMGLGVVKATTGIKPAFKGMDGYDYSKMEEVAGLDAKGNIEAYTGLRPGAEQGLFVFKDGKLLFKKTDRIYHGVTILDDYILAYMTMGGYNFSNDDTITAIYAFDLEGNEVDSMVWSNGECEPGEPCTSTGINGRIVNAGGNKAVILMYPDMMYVSDPVDPEPHRRMYDMLEVSNDELDFIEDDVYTDFDAFVKTNQSIIPYVDIILFTDDYRVIGGDDRMIADVPQRFLAVYDSENELVFQTTDGLDYDDYYYIVDVAVLDENVILLINQEDDMRYIFVYDFEGHLISSTNVGENAKRVIGHDNTFSYNTLQGLKTYVHYTIDVDLKGDGQYSLALKNYENIEGAVSSYVYPGDAIVVGVLPDEGRELKYVKVNGEKIECEAGDYDSICEFEMPEKDAEVEIVIEPIPYKILEGANPKFTKDEKVVVRSEGALELLDSVTVNGKALVKNKDYTVRNGSTIVQLSQEYLNSLKNGEYELSINFTDGRSSVTTLTIAKNPNTADIIGIVAILCVLSFIMVASKKVVRKKAFKN